MTFSYSIGDPDEDIAAISAVRFELGDTEDGRGVRATGANITDEELTIVYDRESAHVMRTVAGLCEMLARDWSRVASTTVGPRSTQYGNIAKEWAARGKELREQYGGAAGTGGFAFSVAAVRADGYAENATDAVFDGWDYA